MIFPPDNARSSGPRPRGSASFIPLPPGVSLLDRLAPALAGRYRIERELGAGGMATVYLAQDLRHARSVAIKVLHPELSAAIGAARFLAEIRTTANLQHPHILPLYDSGEAEGFLFYVMPYVAGESLRDRLDREKQLPLDDALAIAREVADALSYAHAQGVVHRDIKPENVLLASGHAVVADFGIARAYKAAGGDRLTGTGISIGTPRYMSPEQVAAEGVIDGRSDIYSLACMLYEMLSGQPPFTGPTAESVLHQHLAMDPRSITELRRSVPPAVAAGLARALAKAPADRFTSASQFAQALGPTATVSTAAPAAVGRLRWPIVAGAIALVLATLAGWAATRGGGAGEPDVASVAVLPFTDLSAARDQEYFGDGLTDELINALSNVEGLRVAGRASAFYFKGREVSAREVGAQLDVGAVVEGSVQRAADRVRIRVQLTNARDGFTMWSDTYDRDVADIFAVQDEVARAIVGALAGRLLPAATTVIVTPHGTTVDAYSAYLQGRFHLNRRTTEDIERAVDFFNTALRLDSTYARAWSGLAAAYTLLIPSNYGEPSVDGEEMLRRAERAARRAIVLQPQLADAHASFGLALVSQWRWNEAASAFRQALASSPHHGEALFWYATDLISRGRLREAIEQLEAAHKIDPLSLIIGAWLAEAYFVAGEVDKAEAVMARLLELHPASPRVRDSAFLLAFRRGRFAEGVNHLAVMAEAIGQPLADVDAIRAGVLDERTRAGTFRELSRLPQMRGSRAAALLALAGDVDGAARLADEMLPSPSQAYAMPALLFTRVPEREVREHPRFQAMLQRVGLDWR